MLGQLCWLQPGGVTAPAVLWDMEHVWLRMDVIPLATPALAEPLSLLPQAALKLV